MQKKENKIPFPSVPKDPFFSSAFFRFFLCHAFSSSIGYASCSITVEIPPASIALRRLSLFHRLCYLQAVFQLLERLQRTRKKMKTQKASRKLEKIAYEKKLSTPQSESNLKSQFWQAERMVENERI